MNNQSVCYCFIKKEYLTIVYGLNKTLMAKYKNRPFIYFKQISIAIAIPEVSNHRNELYDLNLYFDQNRHFLDVESLVFVKKEHIIIDSKFNRTINNQRKLKEIINIMPQIESHIKAIFYLMKTDSKFRQKHQHILISKIQTKN